MTNYKQHIMKQLRIHIYRLRWLIYLDNHINDQEKINPNYLSVLIGLFIHGFYENKGSNASKAKILASVVHIHMATIDPHSNHKIDANSNVSPYMQATFQKRSLFKFVNGNSWLWGAIFEYFGVNKTDGFLGIEKYITLLFLWLCMMSISGELSLWQTVLSTFLDLGVVFPVILSAFTGLAYSYLNKTGVKPYNKPLCKWIIHKAPRCTKGYFLRYMYTNRIEPDFSNDSILTIIEHGMFTKASKWSAKKLITHLMIPSILTKWHTITNFL